MSRLLGLIRYFLCFTLHFLEAIEEKPFAIIIPSSNKENLQSVLEQKYHHYRVIYIDDASSDGTAEQVMQYEPDKQCTLIKNFHRNGRMASMAHAVFLCDKNEIVVDLYDNSGLAHDHALSYLNQIYADPSVWMTYGPSSIYDYGASITTFYAGLFQLIDKKDFLFEGQFIQNANDLTYALPILEMAGEHCRSTCINENLVEEMDRMVPSRKKYAPLDQFPPQDVSIYSQIKDLYHPAVQDYNLVQNFLSYGKRDNIELLGDTEVRVRNIRIIGAGPEELPHSEIVSVNCPLTDRENCIMIYASFNQNYPRGLKRLLNLISKSDFKGHVLYRLGGWPDTEGGSLPLAHVPYAFKVAFFNEAKRLGFKRALWLDTAVVPLVSLNTIFEMIKEKGCFVMSNGRMAGPHMNATAAAYFGLSLDQTQEIPSCAAGLFGVDFTNKLGSSIIERWYRAAFDKDAFFSPRSDQSALSVILYQLGIGDFIGLDRLPHTEIHEEAKPDSLFLLDRGHVW